MAKAYLDGPTTYSRVSVPDPVESFSFATISASEGGLNLLNQILSEVRTLSARIQRLESVFLQPVEKLSHKSFVPPPAPDEMIQEPVTKRISAEELVKMYPHGWSGTNPGLEVSAGVKEVLVDLEPGAILNRVEKIPEPIEKDSKPKATLAQMMCPRYWNKESEERCTCLTCK